MKIENFQQVKNNVNINNAALFYKLAHDFNFTDFTKRVLSYIERFFVLVCENKNFLELDLDSFRKIISSSEINIDCEIEIFNAIDSWVKYDFQERSDYLIYFLSKVRLSLLSDHAINAILSSSFSYRKIDGFTAILKDELQKRRNLDKNILIIDSNRYCSQNNFDILISCGTNDKLNRRFMDYPNKTLSNIQQIDSRNFNTVKELAPIKHGRKNAKSVYCRGAVYLFGGLDEDDHAVIPVEKYSLLTNSWETVANMIDYRTYGFCSCAFMDQVYIIGHFIYSSLKFDTKNNKWKVIPKMNEERTGQACTVFGGRIVVCGGWNVENPDGLNSVVAYDPFSHSWTSMPRMIERRRFNHKLIAMRNKLFVVGNFFANETILKCEVFDSASNRFVSLKECPSLFTFDLNLVANAFLIENKIVIVGHESSTALCYDVAKNEIFEETCDVTKEIWSFCSTLVPLIKL